jgi:fumarylacetoacetate (FAA) hydrolase family protein
MRPAGGNIPVSADALPEDAARAVLIGRIETADGPTPIALVEGQLLDLSPIAPTISELLETADPVAAAREGKPIGDLALLDPTPVWDGGGLPRLLAPIDLQCIKAAGVTFAVSAIERVIEERARGDHAAAAELRAGIQDRIGTDLRAVRPGTEQAASLKALLVGAGLWSQYLEVAIGPDAEVFTKAPVLSAVGTAMDVGIRHDSEWNNPEPEVVIVCDSRGRALGATLGNDVNLRDIEGRSALLLGKAKDNNASCAIGPFIRLFDDGFTMDDVRRAEVSMLVTGDDGFRMEGRSSMAEISRDPIDLVGQTIGRNHRYPDGFVLFTGTMFAPTDDRGAPGRGFTHKVGDIVEVATPKLGKLVNRVVRCEDAPPWEIGIAALYRNLAQRGLLR